MFITVASDLKQAYTREICAWGHSLRAGKENSTTSLLAFGSLVGTLAHTLAMSLGTTSISVASTFLTTAVATASDTTEKATNLPAFTTAAALRTTARLPGATLLLATDAFAVTERLAGPERFHEPFDEFDDLLTTLLLQFFTGINRGNCRWCGHIR